MSNGKPVARHYCDYSDCGKSFRRAEHLTRHKLNHSNATIRCPQCDRYFYRRDLLQRHLTLKHGKASKGTPSTTGITSPVVVHEVSPSGAPENALPAQRPEERFEFSQTGIATDGPILNDVTMDNQSTLAFPEIFQFASPSLDLAQDWGWIHQNPLPVIPGNAEPISQVDESQEGLEVSPYDDWIDPLIVQDLYISQEVYGFLTTLGPVIEANRAFDFQGMSHLLNHAFLHIMETLAIFHRPTFNFDFIHRQLCATIFCVGLLTSQENGLYDIGCALLRYIQDQLLRYVEQNTIYSADLGTLQAMLLVEYSGMYLADRAAMELSDIFHGVLVTLCRRLGLFESTYLQGPAASSSTEGSAGVNSIQNESAKRFAFFVFALDVQHALFFGHSRSISSMYSIKLELPTDEAEWQAFTQGAQKTKKQRGLWYRTRYDQICHTLLSEAEGHKSIPSNLPQLSNFLILLGLSSGVLDFLRRQKEPFFETRHALSRLGSVLPAIHSRLMAGPEGAMKTHGRAVYHITVIALCTPLDDLEQAANDGFSRTGRTPKQHTRAAIIRLLTKHKVGAEPARHAVHLLKLYLMPPLNPEPPSDQGAVDGLLAASGILSPTIYSPYEPSALYFGVLTLWAYLIGRVSDDDEGAGTQAAENSSGLEAGSHAQQSRGPSSSPFVSITADLQDIEAAIDKEDGHACRRHWRKIVQHVSTKLAARRNSNAQEYSQVLRLLSDNISI